jgi:cell division protease FtsH
LKNINKLIDGFFDKNSRRRLWAALVMAVTFTCILVVADRAYFAANIPQYVSYAQYLADLNAGNIDTIYYSSAESQMRYTLVNDITRAYKDSGSSADFKKRTAYDYDKSEWRMTLFPGGDFRKLTLEADGKINLVIREFAPMSSVFLNFIASLVLLFIIIAAVLKILQYLQPGGKKYGKTLNVTTKFSDVIGQDEVLADLQFIVDMMKGKHLDALGARIPKGILLQGPPGTGKTLIARAVAGEAGVPYFSANASEFIEMYVGVGAKRVRELFKQARKHAPSIIFIDEIDAVARSRSSNRVSTSENDQTINALLQEMDGFSKTTGVFLIAATNVSDQLDDAILRAGRFDRQITVLPPRDWKVRLKLFEHYVGKTACTADLTSIAKQCISFTGADIDATVNEAKLIAAMNGEQELNSDCFEHAMDKRIFKANRKSSSGLKERHGKDIKRVAYHEAGHAVMTYLSGETVARATIIGSTGGIGGVVFQADKDGMGLNTKTDYELQIRIKYAGRIVEELILDDISDGASNDITEATRLLNLYVTKYGMDEVFGPIDLSVLCPNMVEIPALERVQVLALLFMNETRDLIKANMNLVHIVAAALIEKETLTGDEVIKLIEDVGVKN